MAQIIAMSEPMDSQPALVHHHHPLDVGTAGYLADRSALQAFFDATGGKRRRALRNWVHRTGWRTEAPLGYWYGVTLNEDKRVEKLELGDNNCRGSIPAVIHALEALTVLHLFNNSLSGPLPRELGSLSLLTKLELSFNALTGSIPPELGDLSQLIVLDLSYNKLGGEIPAELGRLSLLQILRLERNHLSGVVPCVFCKMESLHIFRWKQMQGFTITGGPQKGETGDTWRAGLRQRLLREQGVCSENADPASAVELRSSEGIITGSPRTEPYSGEGKGMEGSFRSLSSFVQKSPSVRSLREMPSQGMGGSLYSWSAFGYGGSREESPRERGRLVTASSFRSLPGVDHGVGVAAAAAAAPPPLGRRNRRELRCSPRSSSSEARQDPGCRAGGARYRGRRGTVEGSHRYSPSVVQELEIGDFSGAEGSEKGLRGTSEHGQHASVSAATSVARDEGPASHVPAAEATDDLPSAAVFLPTYSDLMGGKSAEGQAVAEGQAAAEGQVTEGQEAEGQEAPKRRSAAVATSQQAPAQVLHVVPPSYEELLDGVPGRDVQSPRPDRGAAALVPDGTSSANQPVIELAALGQSESIKALGSALAVRPVAKSPRHAVAVASSRKTATPAQRCEPFPVRIPEAFSPTAERTKSHSGGDRAPCSLEEWPLEMAPSDIIVDALPAELMSVGKLRSPPGASGHRHKVRISKNRNTNSKTATINTATTPRTTASRAPRRSFGPTIGSEPVVFSCRAPPAVCRGVMFSLRVSACLRRQKDDGGLSRNSRAAGVTGSAEACAMRIVRKKRVTVALDLPQDRFEVLQNDRFLFKGAPAQPAWVRDFVWTGEAEVADFAVGCREDAPVGPARCTATVIEGDVVMRLSFHLEVVAVGSRTGMVVGGSEEELDTFVEEVRGDVAVIRPEELEIERVLGNGVQGETFAGLWRGMPVAIKRIGGDSLFPERTFDFEHDDPPPRRTFSDLLHDAKVLTQLGRHPNVVDFCGLCRRSAGGTAPNDDDSVEIVTKLEAGGSIERALGSGKRARRRRGGGSGGVLPGPGSAIGAGTRMAWARDLACGLANCHSAGVVHGDVSCSNAVLSRRGSGARALLCDFGVSDVLRAAELKRESVVDFSAGERWPLRRLPKETWGEPYALSASSDSWMYGTFVYEVFAGRAPFADLEMSEVKRLVLEGKRLETPDLLREYGDRVVKMYESCLSPDWWNRPSMEDVVATLSPPPLRQR